MIRHSIIRPAVFVWLVSLCCWWPLYGNAQHHNQLMEQQTAPLIGDYSVSFKSPNGVLRYVLHIDSVKGMFFYGSLDNDQRYHPKRNDHCAIRGMLVKKKHYDFVMMPVFDRKNDHQLPCLPHEWLLNNRTYFSFREKNVINGYMVVQNDHNAPNFTFSGMKQEDTMLAASSKRTVK